MTRPFHAEISSPSLLHRFDSLSKILARIYKCFLSKKILFFKQKVGCATRWIFDRYFAHENPKKTEGKIPSVSRADGWRDGSRHERFVRPIHESNAAYPPARFYDFSPNGCTLDGRVDNSHRAERSLRARVYVMLAMKREKLYIYIYIYSPSKGEFFANFCLHG